LCKTYHIMFKFKKIDWLLILKYVVLLFVFAIGLLVASFNSSNIIKEKRLLETNKEKIKLALKKCGCEKTYEEIIEEIPK